MQGKRTRSFSPTDRAHKKGRQNDATPRTTTPPPDHGRKRPAEESASDSEYLPSAPQGPPQPPDRTKPGRPPHADRGRRKDTSSAAKLTGLVPPEPTTPPPKNSKHKSRKKPKVDQHSPQTSRMVAFATQLPSYLQASPPAPPRLKTARAVKSKKPAASSSARSTSSRTIHQVKHDPADGWASAGTASTVEAYCLFETWKNDYSPDGYPMSDFIKITYVGNPVDQLRDLRARPVIFSWATSDRKCPPSLEGRRVPVYRGIYKCTGHCTHGDDSDLSTGNSDDSDEASDDTDDEVGSNDPKPKKKSRSGGSGTVNQQLDDGAFKRKPKPTPHKCRVILHAEVYSDDLSTVHFFQQHTHPEAYKEYLDLSQYLRHCIAEMASLFNLSASSIKRRLLKLMEDHKTPDYRRPTASQVNNIVNNQRRQEKIVTDPLLSIGLFAELNPDKVFHYTEPDYAHDPPRNFATGIHNPFGTQVMILHGSKNGIGHDSTYRHMNENRAPLTIMITVDELGRMVPGFAYLSGDLTTETQITFLQETKALVEKMAADLLNGHIHAFFV
ncbi:hypothetical protein C8J57DRAFT_292398 [Mycena rebaudengoi]|nr:hypothetical protein C8J57DRAFT_292398 [Mycena rebaudengoi]